MLGFLQNHPRALEIAYRAMQRLMAPFQRFLQPGGRIESLFASLERLGKGAVFDCRMCGQCVLHRTGMTCPMTCPKTLRNGPCGGVRPDGHCEIEPAMPCVWVQAWERSRKMRYYADEILHVLPPLDRSLEGTSAWINDFNGIADRAPEGWEH